MQIKKLAAKIRYLINQAKDGIDFTHNEIGYNYRLPNLNAMLGISQIHKLKKFINIKKKIHFLYKKGFENSSNFKILTSPIYSISNNWLNVLEIKSKKYFNYICLEYFLKNNIDVRLIWRPNHSQKIFKDYQAFRVSSK